MPCRSDYLEPTRREAELQRAAKLLVYALKEMDQHIPSRLQFTADSIYPIEDYVPTLCSFLRGLEENARERLIYNPHNQTARDLANWWEEHQAADEAREAEERATVLKFAKKAEVLKKLGITEEELRKLLD